MAFQFLTSYAEQTGAGYGGSAGMGFEQTAHQLIQYILQGKVEGTSFGNFQLDQKAMSKPEFRQMAQQVAQEYQQYSNQMNQVQADIKAFEMHFTARRNNRPVKGVVNINKVGMVSSSQYGQYTHGTISGGIMICPPELYDEMVNMEPEQLGFNFQMNPQWDKKKAQISQSQTQQMTAEHNQRMANQKQQFNAYQDIYKQNQQTYDQQNQAWYDRNFGPGGSSSYSGNESFIDAITGHSTFDDPYTGQQIKKEGHYNNWYTNEFGEYYGTDDPSFDPNSMQGNWNQVDPLKPNY